MDERSDQPNLGSMFLLLLGCTVVAIAVSFVVGWDKFSWLFRGVVFLGGLAAVVVLALRRRRGRQRIVRK